MIHDILAAPEAHSYEYWLHALDEMKIDTARNTVTITRPKAILNTRFLLPASPFFRQTNRFDPPVGEQKRDYMVDNYHLTAATAPAKEAVFLTVLAVTKPGAEPPESELLESPAARVRGGSPCRTAAVISPASPAGRGAIGCAALRPGTPRTGD